MLGVALLLLLSVAISIDAAMTAKRAAFHVCGLLVALFAAEASRNAFRTMQLCVTQTLGALAWISLLSSVTLPEACHTTLLRGGLAGVTNHPNNLGPALACGLIAWLGPHRPRRWAWLFYASGLGMAVALVQSESLTSWMLTGAGFLVYIVARAEGRLRGALVLALLAIGVFVSALGSEIVMDVFFGVTGRDASLSGRGTLWTDVLRAYWDAPILGTGYGAFWYDGRGLELTGTWNPRQSHNAWLDLILELGIVGGLVFAHAYVVRPALQLRDPRWSRGAVRRSERAVLVALGVSLLFVGALAESFFLKPDKTQFFVGVWALAVLNRCVRSGSPRSLASSLRSASRGAGA